MDDLCASLSLVSSVGSLKSIEKNVVVHKSLDGNNSDAIWSIDLSFRSVDVSQSDFVNHSVTVESIDFVDRSANASQPFERRCAAT